MAARLKGSLQIKPKYLPNQSNTSPRVQMVQVSIHGDCIGFQYLAII